MELQLMEETVRAM